MKKQMPPSTKPLPFPYRSFRLSRQGKIAFPPMRELVELLHKPWGIFFLAMALIFNYSCVSILATIPVLANTPIENMVLIRSDASQSLSVKYKDEVPLILSDYLAQRGQFAAKLSNNSYMKPDVDAWLAEIKNVTAQLLGYSVPQNLKEVHLGLVIAMGIDEQAAERYLKALGGDTAAGKEAESEFRNAEERLTIAFQLAPWLMSENVKDQSSNVK